MSSDSQDPNEFVLQYLNFVYFIVYKYRRKFMHIMSFEDMVGYGRLGLVIAAHKFDSSKGVKFTSHASWYIYGQIRQGAKKFGHVMHHKRGQATWYPHISLDEPVGYENEETFVDTLEGDMNDDVLELIQSQEIFDICAKKLTMREAQVIDYMYKHSNGTTETAKKLGVSKQCVNQKRLRAEEKIKNVLNRDWEEEDKSKKPQAAREIRERGVHDAILDQLTEREVKVFKYMFYSKINQWEISVRLGISQGNVSKICQSIRKKSEQLMLN